ncbi:hypothetical protein CWI75_07460 [Kineobactrum sediminis]|uniref:Uncharacterized protein n=1 Tax=Kineobactrum sediminis TaxID=1905677 RepID=A0A2N5Y4D5_9GAMM|nr:hypothetical protein CWI75_07460 [Kineobactrum sediminis]
MMSRVFQEHPVILDGLRVRIANVLIVVKIEVLLAQIFELTGMAYTARFGPLLVRYYDRG